MSWFGDVLHILSPISNLFNFGDDGPDPAIAKQNQLLADQTASAKASADAALAAQQQANAIAASASTPAVDNESARAAADDRRRKLMQGSSFGIGLPDKLGTPPVGFRLLSGQ